MYICYVKNLFILDGREYKFEVLSKIIIERNYPSFSGMNPNLVSIYPGYINEEGVISVRYKYPEYGSTSHITISLSEYEIHEKIFNRNEKLDKILN